VGKRSYLRQAVTIEKYYFTRPYLGIRPLAIITQLTRSSMLDVMSQDYIRTAKAKGLRFYKVIVKHALKNALNPVITAVSGWLASLMAGAFFIEYIFNWKGLGWVTIKSVETKDFPVIMGATLFIALIFVVVNIVVDVLYGAIDPRIRLGE
jgi:peptide/nickel transport system permease protein